MESILNGIPRPQNNRAPSVLASNIKQMKQKLPPVSPEYNIYRIPSQLYRINPTAYTPQVISIGPLHHGQQHLSSMEACKLRCFASFLDTDSKVEAAIAKAQTWEKRARRCYPEHINMSSEEFVKMMLLDGCFILMLMLRCCDRVSIPEPQAQADPFFYPFISIIEWYRDLTMLENQLPFFVLEELYNMLIPSQTTTQILFPQVALDFFNRIQTCKIPEPPAFHVSEKVNHLVHLLKLCYGGTTKPWAENHQGKVKRLIPPTAMELHEAGVVFEKATADTPIAEISFSDGVLKIPGFEVHDASEAYLRNLMAFEHFPSQNGDVISYVAFLDGLIDSEKDVSLLMKADIMKNHVGSNENVSKLFNNLCKDVFISGNSRFNNLSDDLRSHCDKRRNLWMTSLRRDYFNTPWAAISFAGALTLILLTLLQTIFTAASIRR